MPVVYRVLPPDEWDRLRPIAAAMPTLRLPDPGLALAIVAEEGGQGGPLLAVLFVQPALHMEPLIIAPSGVGRVNFLRLASAAESALPSGTEYYCFSTSAKVGRMCELNGMTEAPHHIWRKVVTEPTEAESAPAPVHDEEAVQWAS